MYAAPSYPFYVLALAMYCWPGARALAAGVLPFLTSRVNYLAAVAALAILLVAALLRSSANYGVIVRDKELFEAVARIQSAVPARSLIAMSEELWCDFQLRAYLSRSRHVSLVAARTPADFYLASANASANDLSSPGGYRALSLQRHPRHAKAPIMFYGDSWRLDPASRLYRRSFSVRPFLKRQRALRTEPPFPFY
jgi:hypothetical protein